MNPIHLGSWLAAPVRGLRDVGRGDVILAGALSVLIIGLTTGTLTAQRPPGGVVAAIGALAMTLPVAWERRAPAAAAAAIAAGAAVNELLIGPLVRCGAALPAVFAIAFFTAARCSGRRPAAGAAFCFGAVVTQSFYDPQLGPAFLVAGLPVTAGFCLAGQLVRSRGRAAAALRDRNAELRAQREQTAQLAVAADRGHITISVVNGPAAAAPSGLERTGGSRGLAGLRERAAACGGDLTAGPADGGGWQVLARLPVRPGPAGASAVAGDRPLTSGPGAS